MIVVSIVDQFHMRDLTNRYTVPVLQSQRDLLTSGQAAVWRNHCGDSYVNAVYYGRRAYLTLQLTSLDYSESTIRQQTTNLKIDVGDWVSAGYSETRKQEITSKYSKYNVYARVVSYGSSVPVSDATISLASAMDFIKAFENEPYSAANEYPIDYELTDYAAMGTLPNLPNHVPYRATLDRWYNWDAQLAVRCEMFDDNLNPPTFIDMNADARAVTGLSLREACFYMKRAVMENIQRCEDTTRWSECIQPDSGSCTISDNVAPSMTCLAYANRFPRWQPASAALHLNDRISGGGLSSETRTVRGSATLPAASILERRIQGSVDCGSSACPAVRQSVIVQTVSANNTSNPGNSWDAASLTLSAWVTIHRNCCFAAGAWIDQYQTVYGLTPTTLSYLF
jgi:hypothetical protein